jgi:hypothetical protein
VTPFEAGRVVFAVSRSVCDVERFHSDEDEPMAACKAKAAAAPAQHQESIRAHDCLKSLGIMLIPASAPDFFLV